MKIVVLAGGISTERDVSIVTGTQVCHALRRNGHQAILVDVYVGVDDDKVSGIFDAEDDIDALAASLKEMTKDIDNLKHRKCEAGNEFFGPNVISLCKQADIVFMALHGENGENEKIQAAFDLLSIKYSGTGYLGSALAMDKSLSKQLFVENGIPTPKGVLVSKDNVKNLENFGIKLPVVVKPCCGGSSVGVSIATTDAEYDEALCEAFRYETDVIVEEYVKGREFSIGVIEGEALPIIEISPIEGFYDYTNKYVPGKTKDTCPAVLTKEQTDKLQACACRVFEVLKLNTYARVDFLMNDDSEIFCLEANTLPGMTPTSLLPQEAAATGMSFDELCEKLIKVSLKKYN